MSVPVFIRRRKKGPDPYVRWKMASFVVGALIALVGMGLEDRRVVAVAMVVLGIGFLLRFLPAGEEEGTDSGAAG